MVEKKVKEKRKLGEMLIDGGLLTEAQLKPGGCRPQTQQHQAGRISGAGR
jgi:hypothetical protein